MCPGGAVARFTIRTGVVSGSGLEEVKGHDWVVEKSIDLWLRSSPSRRVFINVKLPYPTSQEIVAHHVKICK